MSIPVTCFGFPVVSPKRVESREFQLVNKRESLRPEKSNQGDNARTRYLTKKVIFRWGLNGSSYQYEYGYNAGKAGYQCSNYDADCSNGLSTSDTGSQIYESRI